MGSFVRFWCSSRLPETISIYQPDSGNLQTFREKVDDIPALELKALWP